MFCPQFQSAEVDFNTLIINYFWVQMELALVKNRDKVIMMLSFLSWPHKYTCLHISIGSNHWKSVT